MGEMRQQIQSIDDREIDRVAAIIKSMTPDERANPKIINGSRRARIALGSGTHVSEVNNLVGRFFEARKMMRQATAGVPGMPGVPGPAGGGRRKVAKGKKKPKTKAGRSGNPAKRAAQAQARAQEAQARAQEAAVPPLESGPAQVPPGFKLPREFKDLLPPDQR